MTPDTETTQAVMNVAIVSSTPRRSVTLTPKDCACASPRSRRFISRLMEKSKSTHASVTAAVRQTLPPVAAEKLPIVHM